MKPIPCTIIVNNWIGYCFAPKKCKSIREAYRYGKEYAGGFYFRVFNVAGECVKRGFCGNN